MLISYPVLPAAAIHDDEDVYLGNIVEGHVLAYEGIYPVSTSTTAQGPMHRWHGGIHLFGGGEPIRAIADGTVVACRFAAQPETYEPYGAYDTSFVLLRHETQTGENTTVVFYSLYMHLANQSALAADRLSQLPQWLRQGPGPDVRRPDNQRVWRKDVLGFAGQLYGREAMHFEVFMLDADFQRVWRDSTAITEGTGSDDWFGDAHFVIPAQQQFSERHPRAAATGAHRIDFANTTADFPLDVGTAGQNDATLYVSVSLQRGRRIATTYRASAEGGYERVGAAVVQDNYEYELYRLACALYPDCPSAGLEWLRFGRVLGPDTTTRNENWQLVRYSDSAVGYIDLAPNSIAKLSDADFPHWLGWDKRDEGETASAADGVCDDERTLELVRRARGDDEAARRLQHLVCKAPSEWDNSDLAARYARLRVPGQSLESDENWQRFSDHVGKLAFWSQAGLAERSVWHFHPLRFVRQFRQCGWLSQSELSQTLPKYLFYTEAGNPRTAITTNNSTYTLNAETALARIGRFAAPLNNCMRKYLGSPKERLAHFLAQVLLETAQWRDLGGQRRLFHEWSFGQFSAANPATQYYSAFYGRGIMQLTWAGNYRLYGAYRNLPHHTGLYVERLTQNPRITETSVHYDKHPTDGGVEAAWAPRYDPDIVGEQPFEACDSGGFYWISKSFSEGFSINRVVDRGYSAANVGFINRLVNGGGNGYYERQAYARYTLTILGDGVEASVMVEITPPSPKAVVRANISRPV